VKGASLIPSIEMAATVSVPAKGGSVGMFEGRQTRVLSPMCSWTGSLTTTTGFSLKVIVIVAVERSAPG